MLLSREEMTYSFPDDARLDPVRDKEMLAWMFNQFLYGEVTGIQCGHWLYNAPDLSAARFLAKQSLEEFQHVDNFLQCLAFIGAEPEPPHSVVRFLSTGMMPDDWAEHVSLEMAQGEGFVLMAFYALIDTLDHDGIVQILSRAVKQEERHVEFGEQRTMDLIAGDDMLRRRLVGLNLVSIWSVKRLASHMQKTMDRDHPLLRHLPRFLDLVVSTGETRMQRIGLIDRPLADIPRAKQFAYVALAYGHKGVSGAKKVPMALVPFKPGPSRLTDTYLGDASITQKMAAARIRARDAADADPSSLAA